MNISEMNIAAVMPVGTDFSKTANLIEQDFEMNDTSNNSEKSSNQGCT